MRTITRRRFLKGCAAGAALAAAHGALPPRLFAAGDRPPNILLIYIDDLGWKDLACMGSRYYETPHIDRLASQGVLFRQAYSNGPNCMPAGPA